ncbi:MAG TPA: hypothetical protein VIS72_13735, partial [Anaerolineales bacterium]
MTTKTFRDLLNLENKELVIDETLIVNASLLELFILSLNQEDITVELEKPAEKDNGEITIHGKATAVGTEQPQEITVELVFKAPENEDQELDKSSFKRAVITLAGEWSLADYFYEFAPWGSEALLEDYSYSDAKIVIAAEDWKDGQTKAEKGLSIATTLNFPPLPMFDNVDKANVSAHIAPRDGDWSIEGKIDLLDGSILGVKDLSFSGQVAMRTIQDDKKDEKRYLLFTFKVKAEADFADLAFTSDFKLESVGITLGNAVVLEGETVDTARMMFWMELGGEMGIRQKTLSASAQFPLMPAPLIDLHLKVDDDESQSGVLDIFGTDNFINKLPLTFTNYQVSGLNFVFDPANKQIRSVQMTVEQETPEKPLIRVDNVLSVEKVKSDWTIHYPLLP